MARDLVTDHGGVVLVDFEALSGVIGDQGVGDSISIAPVVEVEAGVPVRRDLTGVDEDVLGVAIDEDAVAVVVRDVRSDNRDVVDVLPSPDPVTAVAGDGTVSDDTIVGCAEGDTVAVSGDRGVRDCQPGAALIDVDAVPVAAGHRHVLDGRVWRLIEVQRVCARVRDGRVVDSRLARLVKRDPTAIVEAAVLDTRAIASLVDIDGDPVGRDVDVPDDRIVRLVQHEVLEVVVSEGNTVDDGALCADQPDPARSGVDRHICLVDVIGNWFALDRVRGVDVVCEGTPVPFSDTEVEAIPSQGVARECRPVRVAQVDSGPLGVVVPVASDDVIDDAVVRTAADPEAVVLVAAPAIRVTNRVVAELDTDGVLDAHTRVALVHRVVGDEVVRGLVDAHATAVRAGREARTLRCGVVGNPIARPSGSSDTDDGAVDDFVVRDHDVPTVSDLDGRCGPVKRAIANGDTLTVGDLDTSRVVDARHVLDGHRCHADELNCWRRVVVEPSLDSHELDRRTVPDIDPGALIGARGDVHEATGIDVLVRNATIPVGDGEIPHGDVRPVSSG